jgi:toxin HigB-1
VYNQGVIHRVELTRRVQRQLRRIPRHVVIKLMAWVEMVETQGLEETRKIPGFHDEPLRGPRSGQRSIRLSRSYRAIYRIVDDEVGELVIVEEVSKHAY